MFVAGGSLHHSYRIVWIVGSSDLKRSRIALNTDALLVARYNGTIARAKLVHGRLHATVCQDESLVCQHTANTDTTSIVLQPGTDDVCARAITVAAYFFDADTVTAVVSEMPSDDADVLSADRDWN